MYYYNGRSFEALALGVEGLSLTDIEITEEPVPELFLGTSMGVYRYHFKEGKAKQYGSMPRLRVNEIDLNPGNWSIYAATFGRGIWKTTLPPMKTFRLSSLPLNAEVNYAFGSLKVEKKEELKLRGKLFMPPGSVLSLAPGSELIVENEDAIFSFSNDLTLELQKRNVPRWLRWIRSERAAKLTYRKSYLTQ